MGFRKNLTDNIPQLLFAVMKTIKLLEYNLNALRHNELTFEHGFWLLIYTSDSQTFLHAYRFELLQSVCVPRKLHPAPKL